MSNTTISRRMAAGVMAVSLATVFAAAASFWYIRALGQDLEQSTGVVSAKLALAGEAKAAANIMRTGQRSILLNGYQHDPEALKASEKDYAKRREVALSFVNRLKPMADKGDSEAIARLESAIGNHADSFAQIAALCREGNLEAAMALYKAKGSAAGAAMEQAASDVMAVQTRQLDQRAATGRKRVAQAGAVLAGSEVFVALCLAALLWSTRRSANGLRLLSGTLRESARQVAAASAQVAASGESLARGASEDAASIEETSAASQQIYAIIRKNEESVRLAVKLTDHAGQTVTGSNQALDAMTAAMQAINTSGSRIAKIIKVIDEIAFQTNILALNAAVEAARAGEAGAGFSVVADEVRNLAQRSSAAARDTTGLIEESISTSAGGSASLQTVAGLIREMAEMTQSVRTAIEQINSRSTEESAEMEEITKAIARLGQTAQEIAANSEESAATGRELANQAESLEAIVGELETLVGR